MGEIFMPIPGFEGYYEASSFGRIKSMRKKTRIMALSNSTNGYLLVCLRMPRIKKTYSVHRAVMEAFNGVRELGMVVNHKNGIKTDNRLSNLEYCTCKENIRHAMETGLTTHYGRSHENHNSAKLTNELVAQMRSADFGKLTMREIGKLYGVTAASVNNILKYKSWK